jgi:hypothetical protein
MTRSSISEETINMEHFWARLNELPDEILLIILKKLHNVEVLYYLIGVHNRLNMTARDSIFSSCFELISIFSASFHLFIARSNA